MTISTYTTIAKTFIKLVKLVVKYEKGELQKIEPSVWDQYIGEPVWIITEPPYQSIHGILIEKDGSNVTLLDDGDYLFIPNARLLASKSDYSLLEVEERYLIPKESSCSMDIYNEEKRAGANPRRKAPNNTKSTMEKFFDSGYAIMSGVESYLESNEYLVDILIDAMPHLKRIFPKDTQFIIKPYRPHGLIIYMNNIHPTKRSIEHLLYEFDEEWWAANAHKANNKLQFRISKGI